MSEQEHVSFSSLSDIEAGMLRCPECGELLHSAELATYFECPFCRHKFQNDEEFQDFLDSLAVQAWTQAESGRMTIEIADPDSEETSK